MTYKGHVKNGAIVLDEDVELPEGVSVQIEVADLLDRFPISDGVRRVSGLIRPATDGDRERYEALRDKHG